MILLFKNDIARKRTDFQKNFLLKKEKMKFNLRDFK